MSGTSKKLTRPPAGSGRLSARAERNSRTDLVVKHKPTLVKAKKAKPSSSSLAERARRAAAAITDEEDAAITAAAMADPDALPNRYIGKRRGRPKAASTKELVTLRLDPDVLRFFRGNGDGWQTRINDALRKAARLG
jgi:uncharacterized protein (DUF4415 family)